MGKITFKYREIFVIACTCTFMLVPILSCSTRFLGASGSSSTPAVASAPSPKPASNHQFGLAEMFTIPYNDQHIHHYLRTAYFNDSTRSYQLYAYPPYAASKELISTNLLFADYYVLSGNLTVYANVPAGTSIHLFLSNNFFRTCTPVINGTPATFPQYGRQLAYKIVLETTDPAATPDIFGVDVNCTGADYGDVPAPNTPIDVPANLTTESLLLGDIVFTYNVYTITYRAYLDLTLRDASATRSTLEVRVFVYLVGMLYLDNQINWLRYDYNLTINNVPTRFYHSQTGFVTHGGDPLGTIILGDITVLHAEGEAVNVAGFLTYHFWNGNGGDLQGSKSSSSLLGLTQPASEQDPDNLDGGLIAIILIITGSIGGVVVVALAIRHSKKDKSYSW